MFIVIIDAYSKWPEVKIMNSTTATATISVLRELFSRFGLCEQLVCDNGPQFTSSDFKEFMRSNGIKHITSAPFHPSTKGLAEWFVQTFKQALRAVKDSSSLQKQLDQFLLSYRNAEHSTTHESPSMLFLGHPLRSRLDLPKPDVHNTVENQQASQMQYRGRKALVSKERSFQPGDHVLARDYRGNGNKWIPSVIKNRLGSVSYLVEPNDGNGVLWRRHIEQLKKCHVPANQEELLSNVPQVYPDLVTQNYDHVSDNQVIVDPTSDSHFVIQHDNLLILYVEFIIFLKD